MFSCEICEILKNTFFYRTPPVSAFAELFHSDSNSLRDAWVLKWKFLYLSTYAMEFQKFQ